MREGRLGEELPEPDSITPILGMSEPAISACPSDRAVPQRVDGEGLHAKRESEALVVFALEVVHDVVEH